ncbi:urease accessory protein UreF [Leptothermofonsia sichuanensis E412]|nr:urease accessory protein UreF [Leptothermofonsia sichuanensis]QZZ19114.1 urease accessory protein UreF [Leptothermofonsia sichuanensis E412]
MSGGNEVGLLRLLQLVSPGLPVGAYSYSEGLEFLVQVGKIQDEEGLEQWLIQELRYGAARLDAAVMVRSYRSLKLGDFEAVCRWNRWLSATRETEELRSQNWQMGRSLLRLFLDLQPGDMEGQWFGVLKREGCNFAIAFGVVAAEWGIDLRSAVLGYLHSWVTNLVGAGVKLIPLGQTTGQQLILSLNPELERATEEVLNLVDGDLCSCGWGLTLASMSHETQYSRLFRS